jgi:hypothetical protein
MSERNDRTESDPETSFSDLKHLTLELLLNATRRLVVAAGVVALADEAG